MKRPAAAPKITAQAAVAGLKRLAGMDNPAVMRVGRCALRELAKL